MAPLPILQDSGQQLEAKLTGLAFGLLIPVFFVTSGMAIDPAAVAANPLIMVLFVVLILLVRGVPVLIATRLDRDPVTGLRSFDHQDSLRVALYASTGLPIIVAVTAVTVEAGQMSTDNASVLVAGGAITVLLLPLTSTLLARPAPSSTARVCPSPAAAGRVSGQRAEVLKLYGYSTGAWGTGTVTATQPPCIQTAARRTGPEPDESPVHANPPLPPPALDSWLHAPRMIASAGRKGLGVRVRTGIFNNRGRAMEDRLLYRVPEVAVILNISRSKVYELFSSGDLESVKIDRSRLVRSSDLRAYVDGLRPVDKSA